MHEGLAQDGFGKNAKALRLVGAVLVEANLFEVRAKRCPESGHLFSAPWSGAALDLR